MEKLKNAGDFVMTPLDGQGDSERPAGRILSYKENVVYQPGRCLLLAMLGRRGKYPSSAKAEVLLLPLSPAPP